MPALTDVALDLVDRLAEHGGRPALITETESLSYAELDARVREVAERLGPRRRLVLVEAANTVDAVVAYLGALRGRHAVVLADASRPELLDDLARRFRPEVRVGEGVWSETPGAGPDLHPDLALLLSTSGSTASPKLVRLSFDNVASNAAAIADYLGLRPTDRAITSLPLGYCYGLSVLHSHLHRGAGVVLTRRSVQDPAFWDLFARTRATSFAAVPHTLALLDRSGLPWYATPSLRQVTQAGGRLPAPEVRRHAATGRAHGWELFVMYGQTEATARLAYLPPSAVPDHAHCVGRAIPGGRLWVESPDRDGVGELRYAGPNVMMGYAEQPGDLAAPPGPAELRTGDLGREAAPGLFEVVGRLSRFAKILGQRIALDRVEAVLAPLADEVVCTTDDSRLVIAAVGGDAALLRRHASAASGLPAGLVTVHPYGSLPRLGNGKVDHRALLERLAVPAAGPAGEPPERLTAVRAAYAEVLGYDTVEDTATFLQLGGDSLSFVEMSLRLEELLAEVPPEWPELSVAEIATRPPAASRAAGPGPVRVVASGAGAASAPPLPDAPTEPGRAARPRPTATALRRVRLDTSVLLRGAAIVLVVLAHLQVWPVRGGAHLLLVVAGFTFARFGLNTVRATDSVRPLGGSILKLALPSMVFIAAVVALGDGYGPANLVLLNHYLGPSVWTAAWNFWFLEALVEIMVAALLLFSVPAVRRFERVHPVLLPAAVLAVGLVVRYNPYGWFDSSLSFGRPHLIFWLFALGWLIQRSSSAVPGRLLVSLLGLVALTGYFPDEPVRVAVVQAGMLLLVWAPFLPVPAPVAVAFRRLAAASLWIYLTHWFVWPWLLDTAHLPWLVVLAGCLLVGVAAHTVAAALTHRVLSWLRTRQVRSPVPLPSRQPAT